MYLRKLRVRNIKLLRDVEIDFTRGDSPRAWTVLIGENGLCKTTLLQAIALAASGPDRANQLADVPSLCDRRHNDRSADIEAEFGFGERGHAEREYPGLPSRPTVPPRLISRLRLQPGWKVFQGDSSYLDVTNADAGYDPLREARARGLPGWFVAGYGTRRTLPKSLTTDRPTDPVVERLDTLFDHGTLIATKFGSFLPRNAAFLYARSVLEIFLQGALLPDASTLATRLGAFKVPAPLPSPFRLEDFVDHESFDFDLWVPFKGEKKGGMIVPSRQSSQGYQATIAWVTDLLGQRFLERPDLLRTPVPPNVHPLSTPRADLPGKLAEAIDASDLEGLVLLDELDLHLHPSWQVKLIPTLKKAFPKLQFVTTTHSPMVLSGLEQDEILRLQQLDNGDVCVETPNASPALMTGSELYDTYFEIHDLYPNPLGEKLKRYGYLANDPTRSDEEDAEMRALRQELEAAGVTFDWEPAERETGS